MKLIFHICRKDARRHWPEILLFLGLVSTFTWEQPRVWTGQTFEIQIVAGLMKFLPVLLVFCWAFLGIRLVQSESLVGDRQFWITRPYEWYTLLASKLLFLIVFTHLPLLICQMILLKMALFPVGSSIPSLLFVQSMLFLVLSLPAVTLAAITAGFGQASVALLVVLLAFIGVGVMVIRVPDLDFGSDSLVGFLVILYVLASVGVLLVQYVYRRTTTSRIIVGATAVAMLLVLGLAPYQKIILNDYPLPTRDHLLPARFSLDPELSFAHSKTEQPSSYGDEVWLEIPLAVEDLGRGSIVSIHAVKLDVEMSNGERWTSHWHSGTDNVYLGRMHTWPTVPMKKKEYKGIRNSRVHARLLLGLRVYQVGEPTKVNMPGDRLSLPGGGRCLNDLSESWLQCFSALKTPHPIFVMAELPSVDCPVKKEATTEPWAAAPATYADLSADSSPDSAFSPVEQFHLSLSRYYRFEDRYVRLPICTDTPLVLSAPQFQYSVRAEIDLGDVDLSNYVPAYPRIIGPPRHKPAPGEPSKSTSQNLTTSPGALPPA